VGRITIIASAAFASFRIAAAAAASFRLSINRS
jgi:hypothetical protein